MEEKNERIENNIASLREKHGDKYTMIQYRMWSEFIDNGKHRQVASRVHNEGERRVSHSA